MTAKEVILDSALRVPSELVPYQVFTDFRTTIKDREGNETNIEFFDYNSDTDTYSFARGNMVLIRQHFGHLPIRDLRSRVPMSINNFEYPGGTGLNFVGTLRPGQQEVIEQILKVDGFGQLSAPPRFGKTITLVALTCIWKQKALFLSHQQDLSEQMYRSFVKFTNLIDVEYHLGRPVVGIVEKWEDLGNFDVSIMNYQKFVAGKNADQMLLKYKNAFGVTVVDESHRASAACYSKVISNFNPSVRMGVSGTTERKNQMHVINDYVLGPVIAKGTAEQVPCSAYGVQTHTRVPYRPGKLFFTQALTFLSKDKKRNALIMSYLEAYARQGHYIIAVTDRTAHCDLLAKELSLKGIKAEAFHRAKFKNDKDRENCLQRCRTGETQVLIAMRTMVLGLDIPRLTAFFNLLPTANPPNYYQELSRVRTPNPGKTTSYLVDFVDSHHILEACYKSRLKVYHSLDIPITGL